MKREIIQIHPLAIVIRDDHNEVCCRFKDRECDMFVQREKIHYCCHGASMVPVVVESDDGDYSDQLHIKPTFGCPIVEALEVHT